MVGFTGEMFFGGTDALEPVGRDDLFLAGGMSSIAFSDADDDDDADGEDDDDEMTETGDCSRKRAASSTIDGQPKTKRSGRSQGGLAAISRPVTADYGSDDGRIIGLKQQGYSDDYVAQKLIAEGRMRYVPKTVGSRWLRLRKVLERAEDERLDDEMTDWHVGEDDELDKAYEAVDEKIKVEIKKLQKKMWREVAINLAERFNKKKYTARACKERFEGVRDGTALKPLELDSDQEGRKRLRETRIEEAKKRRAERAAEAQRLDEERKRLREEKQAEANAKEMERLVKTSQKEQVKEEERRVKLEKKEEKDRQRDARKAVAQQWRLEEEWRKELRKKQEELYTQLTGKRMKIDPDATPDDDSALGASDMDVDDHDETRSIDEEEGSNSSPNPTNPLISETITIPTRTSPRTTGRKASKLAKAAVTEGKALVTDETLLNARSILTTAELDILLFERNLPKRTSAESHAEIVARLASADEALDTTELSELLTKYFDKGKGSKLAKILRLQDHDAASSKAGLEGLRVGDVGFKEGYVVEGLEGGEPGG